jgi:predicted GNAT superfamily acetyltransferase
VTGVEIRTLESVAECAEITPLTRRVWGPGSPEFGVDLLRAVVHTGGYLSGAYLGPDLVGFSFGLLAEHDGGRSLHSHATGVLGSARGQHVGLALKDHQRAWAAARGLPTITWTFDPLVRRNAWFNLVRLGARPTQYLEDFYGPLDDDLNRSDPSDRLFVAWDVEHPEPGEREVPDGVVLVGTPPDIEGLRRDDLAAAASWRQRQREALSEAMRVGRVVGFTRAGEYVVEVET